MIEHVVSVEMPQNDVGIPKSVDVTKNRVTVNELARAKSDKKEEVGHKVRECHKIDLIRN